MKKKLLIIMLMGILIMLLTACDKQKKLKSEETQQSTTDNKGSIEFADVERSQLEEYADDESNVFLFFVEENSGKSRKEIYASLFKDKANEKLYLASGIVLMSAKDLLELEPIDGMNIVLKEYRYEDYIITREYIDKCEAEFDNVKIFVDEEKAENEYWENNGKIWMEGTKADYQELIIQEYKLDVDWLSRDDMYEDGYFIVANVDKSTMLSLYEDKRIQGMTKCIYINRIMGYGYCRPTVFNGWLYDTPIKWPKK